MKPILMPSIMAAVALTGCASAEIIQKTFEPVKGGVVSYNAAPGSIKKSAELAEAEMAKFCSPDGFVVVRESASSQLVGFTSKYTGQSYGAGYNTVGYSGSTQIVPLSKRVNYIEFRCDQAK